MLQLTFNPGLTLTGFRTTWPRTLFSMVIATISNAQYRLSKNLSVWKFSNFIPDNFISDFEVQECEVQVQCILWVRNLILFWQCSHWYIWRGYPVFVSIDFILIVAWKKLQNSPSVIFYAKATSWMVDEPSGSFNCLTTTPTYRKLAKNAFH